MIPSAIIEEIRSKSDIVNVISEYVGLRKRGKNYVGLCPFHSEKTPSFTVSPEKQFFHCFGCNEGGNVFAFIMKIENINFAGAVEELGTKMGIAVPQASTSSASAGLRDRLLQLTLLAAKYFHACLKEAPGQASRDYLTKRGISEDTVGSFGLGFSPAGWDNLFKHLINRGASPELIEKAGLCLSRENSSGYYDRFRSRLIFPILDPRGRAVAFGGRALGEEEPKYLNSPDTPLYRKGELLYGLNLTKDFIKKGRSAVLVEGYFDLITPFQSGVKNIAASLGTALTISQCKLLARYCDKVTVAYDADSAGGIAAERSVELMRDQGLAVRVARLIGGKDPDEVVRKQGKEAFENCLSSALPFMEFRIERALARFNLKEIEGRGEALRQVAAILSREKDAFVQKEYAKLAASRLSTEAENILAEVKRVSHYHRDRANTMRRITAKPNSKLIEAEKKLLALAIQNREELAAFKEKMETGDFSLPASRAVAEVLLSIDFGERPDLSHFVVENLPDEEAGKFLSEILMDGHLDQDPANRGMMFADCVKVIKGGRAQNRINELKIGIKEAEKGGDAQKAAELLSRLKSEIY